MCASFGLYFPVYIILSFATVLLGTPWQFSYLILPLLSAAEEMLNRKVERDHFIALPKLLAVEILLLSWFMLFMACVGSAFGFRTFIQNL